jgi:DNA-binding MarR family transcriptional regulator
VLDRYLMNQVLFSMQKLSKELDLFFNLSKIQALMTRTFESRLGGLGYNEFIILFHLSQSPDEKMRRIDLANKVGLTASGITRILLPMEKVGYIKREITEEDARVSYVALAKGGKQRLRDRMDDAEELAKELIPEGNLRNVKEFTELLIEMRRNMMS